MVRIALAYAASCLARLAFWGYRPKRLEPEVIVPDQLEIEMPDHFDPSKPGTVIITSTDKPWVQCYPGGWQ